MTAYEDRNESGELVHATNRGMIRGLIGGTALGGLVALGFNFVTGFHGAPIDIIFDSTLPPFFGLGGAGLVGWKANEAARSNLEE